MPGYFVRPALVALVASVTDDPDEPIARALAALGSPLRLRLLRQIRQPSALREIEVPTARDGPERTLSRQGVRDHLDRLIEVGMVVGRHTERAYGQTVEYTVNHQAIYALGEQLRELAKVRSSVEPALETLEGTLRRPPARRGPALILAKGLDEGSLFPLDASEGRQEWIIGRRRGVDIALDYDPFISAENAVVIAEGKKRWIKDLAQSKNGTQLNFERIPSGEARALRHGDAVGIGRSLLLYWERPDMD